MQCLEYSGYLCKEGLRGVGPAILAVYQTDVKFKAAAALSLTP